MELPFTALEMQTTVMHKHRTKLLCFELTSESGEEMPRVGGHYTCCEIGAEMNVFRDSNGI